MELVHINVIRAQQAQACLEILPESLRRMGWRFCGQEKLRAFSAADWQAGTGTAGYTEVLASGGRVIACAVPDPENESALGVEDLKPLFRPIVWEG